MAKDNKKSRIGSYEYSHQRSGSGNHSLFQQRSTTTSPSLASAPSPMFQQDQKGRASGSKSQGSASGNRTFPTFPKCGNRVQSTTSAALASYPIQQGASSGTNGGQRQNRLYALQACQEQKDSPDVVTVNFGVSPNTLSEPFSIPTLVGDLIIAKRHDVSTNTMNATCRAYHSTNKDILEKAFELGKRGSTVVTAMLINSQTLIIANVGDSQAVISKKGVAEQLSVDHEPNREREIIESQGGFVSNIPGDVPRVDGQLAIARVFGDKCLKRDLSSDPNVAIELIDNDVDLIILASDGLWKVMSNQEAVNCIKNMKEVKAAAKHLSEVAISWKSKDDISCIVVKF
ncbi:probable protein phosphatase 2C 58 [Solanum stenotomum]|uniref:probable protein phosphatase 2C 58 n=1 Tax=Solanum stenotomum TaxID=172797 RepID=UPI0020D07498|nr:probable protein phosphatase 2C 58 [Solanum stenotomum]